MQQARIDYWQEIRDIAPEDLVFIDESGLNLAMIRLSAHSPRGQRAIGDRPQKRGQNVSLEEGTKFAYQHVSLEDIKNWFTNCCYCTPPN